MSEERKDRQLADEALSAVNGGADDWELEKAVDRYARQFRDAVCARCGMEPYARGDCGFFPDKCDEIGKAVQSGGRPDISSCKEFFPK